MDYARSLLFSLLQPPQDAIQPKKIFPAANYHPLQGIKAKVDSPTLPFKTIIPARAKFIGTHLNGASINRHFVGSDLYRQAWEVRKSKSYFNDPPFYTQIAHEQRNRPWQLRRGTFMKNDGTNQTVDSREPKIKFENNFFSSAICKAIPQY